MKKKVSWDELRLEIMKEKIELELLVDLGCAALIGVAGTAFLFCIGHLLLGGLL